MDDEENHHGTGEFQERTERLEEMLRDAGFNYKPVEYSLIADELGRNEQDLEYPDTYIEGIRMRASLNENQLERIREKSGIIEAKPKKRRDLRAIAESYSREEEALSAPAEPERKVQPKPYSTVQYENDKGVIGYVKTMGIDIMGEGYIESKRTLVKMALGSNRIRIGPGNGEDAFALVDKCDSDTILQTARDHYNKATKRLQELDRHEREITNGTPPEYE